SDDERRALDAERVREQHLGVGAGLGNTGGVEPCRGRRERVAHGRRPHDRRCHPAASSCSCCCLVASASTIASRSPSSTGWGWWSFTFTRWSVTRLCGKL